MALLKRKRAGPLMMGLIGVAVALCAAPSSTAAVATWTVTPGGATTATATNVTLKDTKTGTVVKCKTSTEDATYKSGSGLPGAKIASITSMTFSGCALATVAVTVETGAFPWYRSAKSYDGSTGVTTAAVRGVDLTFSAPGCSATIGGPQNSQNVEEGWVIIYYGPPVWVPGYWAAHYTGGNMKYTGVSGCFGLVNVGDAVVLGSSHYAVSPTQKITSP